LVSLFLLFTNALYVAHANSWEVTGSIGTDGPTRVYRETSGNSDANFCKSHPAKIAAIIFVGWR
jgi:hypothetical protein